MEITHNIYRTGEFDEFAIARELRYTLGSIWKDWIHPRLRKNHFTKPKANLLFEDMDILDICLQRVEDELSVYGVRLPLKKDKYYQIWKETFREGVKYYISEIIVNSNIKQADLDVLKNSQKFKNVETLYNTSKKNYYRHIKMVKVETGYGISYKALRSQAMGG